MFEAFVETCVGMTDHQLDDAVRATELEARSLAARHAAVIAVAEARGLFRAGGHRDMAAYLRATCNTGDGTIARQRALARLLDAHPAVGDGLVAGRISVDHALELGRIQANPRIRHLLAAMLAPLLDDAEQSSLRDFRVVIDQIITLCDTDGAFADLAAAVEGRSAHAVEVDGQLSVQMNGGDPVTAARFVAVVESFVEGEYRRDLAARREEFGDDADQHPLARTPAQRRFDAMVAMAAAAATSPEGRALPEPTVHIVIDERSTNEALTHGGVTLPTGEVVELDDDGNCDDAALLHGLADELLDDPAGYRRRRCETSTGTVIHPALALRALLSNHVRRVVVDSRGVVIDYGTQQRLFTGLARDAAMLLATGCTAPGCDLPAAWCEVDHIVPWSNGGRTDQTNANIECGHHNRHKHRARLRVRRTERGRTIHQRPDGTLILPVGQRPPDLSIDELNELARRRLRQLAVTRRSSPATPARR